MAIAEIATGVSIAKGTISTVQAGLNLIKQMRGKADGKALPEELESLEKMLYEMMGNVAQLQSEQIELTDEIRALRKRADLQNGYKLAEVSAVTFAYIPVDEEVGSDGRIACPQCYEKEKFSFLLPLTSFGIVSGSCPDCGINCDVDLHWIKFCVKAQADYDSRKARGETY